jgi:hypothetical protein
MQVELGALLPAFTKQLMIYRKRWFTTDKLQQAKRARRDFPETERLRALEQEQAAGAAAAAAAAAAGKQE